mmetsp:Transcript_8426/g.22748  ORF Transcript_8426/g.22748 Transcript_8426/m.22748 type:complete len:200 (+) Transcript_8426:666-1265(+)
MVPNVPWQFDRKRARDVPGAQAEQLSLGRLSAVLEDPGFVLPLVDPRPEADRPRPVPGDGPRHVVRQLDVLAVVERHRAALGTVARLGLPQIRGNHNVALRVLGFLGFAVESRLVTAMVVGVVQLAVRHRVVGHEVVLVLVVRRRRRERRRERGQSGRHRRRCGGRPGRRRRTEDAVEHLDLPEVQSLVVDVHLVHGPV